MIPRQRSDRYCSNMHLMHMILFLKQVIDLCGTFREKFLKDLFITEIRNRRQNEFPHRYFSPGPQRTGTPESAVHSARY